MTATTATTEREKYINFLRNRIENYCDRNGCYTYYRCGYDDCVSEEVIAKCFYEYIENQRGYEKFSHYLENHVYEEWLWDYDQYLWHDIKEDFDNAVDEGLLEDVDLEWDDLYEAGYQGVSFDINEFVDDIRINLLLATANELNHDLSSINQCYTQGYQFRYDDPDKQAKLEKELEDNMLAQLIKQQGYDVTTEYIGGEDIACSDSKFLKSVADELLNGYYDVCQCLTVLTTASLDDLDDLADILLKRDNCKKTITVSKNTMLGLLAPFIGGGSTLDICLDKDFEFSTDMIYDVQIESRDQRSGIHRFYTVDSIYGLCGDAWDSKMKIK